MGRFFIGRGYDVLNVAEYGQGIESAITGKICYTPVRNGSFGGRGVTTACD